MKWISVKDRLPTEEECQKYHSTFLVYIHDCTEMFIGVFSAWYDRNNKDFTVQCTITPSPFVTHWAAINLPNRESDDQLD